MSSICEFVCFFFLDRCQSANNFPILKSHNTEALSTLMLINLKIGLFGACRFSLPPTPSWFILYMQFFKWILWCVAVHLQLSRSMCISVYSYFILFISYFSIHISTGMGGGWKVVSGVRCEWSPSSFSSCPLTQGRWTLTSSQWVLWAVLVWCSQEANIACFHSSFSLLSGVLVVSLM